MNEKLWEQATRLAARQYDISIEQDELSNGATIYLFKHPELPGCKAQGKTINEAKANLDEARADYIYALLEMGLAVPEPASYRPETESVAENKMYIIDASQEDDDFQSVIDTVIAPDFRESILSLSLQGDLVKHD